MYEVKVSLSVTLPGSVMYSKQECLKQLKSTFVNKAGKKITKYKSVQDFDKFDKSTIEVKDYDNSKELLTVYTRKSRNATQIINLSKEAYEYMISNNFPTWSKSNVWRSMKAKARLEAHLNRIAEELGGTILSYQVFEE